MTKAVLKELSPHFNRIYASVGRPAMAPEKLLRLLLLQFLYSIRRERLLMEQLDYNMLFRWYVGLNIDDLVWDATILARTGAACCRVGWPRLSLTRFWIGLGKESCCKVPQLRQVQQS